MKKTARELFRGLGVTLPTPVTKKNDGYKHYYGKKGVVIEFPEHIDRTSLRRWIDDVMKHRPDFLVACDVAAASSLMTYEEHAGTIELIKHRSGAKVPILAGVGSNSTAEVIALARVVKRFVDGLLVITPTYFVKPPEEGVIAHFIDIRREISDLPIVLYDNYLRTGSSISTEAIISLAQQGVIQGVKLASGDPMQLNTILSHRPPGFTVLVANDRHIPMGMAAGADGVISILANLLPEGLQEVIALYQAGKIRLADGMIDNWRELINALEQEINPIPLVTALSLLRPDLFQECFRSPLWPMKPDKKERLVKALRHYGLLP